MLPRKVVTSNDETTDLAKKLMFQFDVIYKQSVEIREYSNAVAGINGRLR